MRTPIALVLTSFLLATGMASAGAPPPAPTPQSPEEAVQLGKNELRMTVPVSIGGSGPYNFIIDTGAERTVISRELAGSLALVGGRPVRVTALAGISDVATVVVPSLTVAKSIARPSMEAPMLDAYNLGATGMLGIDALQQHNVYIDFDHDVMTLRPSKKRWLPAFGAHEIVVRAKNVYGQLIVTNARYHNIPVSVIIDTGSPVTIANSALLSAMRRPPKSLGPISVISATGDVLSADYALIDRLDIGGAGLMNVAVAFADAAPFARFGLSKTPAIMLGMNTLRLFRRVQIDFPNREVRFELPTDPNAIGI